MKGLILSIFISPGIFFCITLILRSRVDLSPIKSCFVSYGILFFVFIYTYFATSKNLGFIPQSLLEPIWLDFLLGVFTYSCSFFGGWLQLYNLTSRGYSLRILIDILKLKDNKVFPEQLIKVYGDGKGLKWMYDTRINDLINSKLVKISGNHIYLSTSGLKISEFLLIMRKIFNIEKMI